MEPRPASGRGFLRVGHSLVQTSCNSKVGSPGGDRRPLLRKTDGSGQSRAAAVVVVGRRKSTEDPLEGGRIVEMPGRGKGCACRRCRCGRPHHSEAHQRPSRRGGRPWLRDRRRGASTDRRPPRPSGRRSCHPDRQSHNNRRLLARGLRAQDGGPYIANGLESPKARALPGYATPRLFEHGYHTILDFGTVVSGPSPLEATDGPTWDPEIRVYDIGVRRRRWR